MIIAITSDGNDLNSNVSENFTRAAFIISYNKDKETFDAIHNPHSAVFVGNGIQTVQLFIEKSAKAVITCDIGLSTFCLLESAYVKVYSCLQ